MSSDSWTRWLGPAALAITVLAVVLILSSATGGGSDEPASGTSTGETQAREAGRTTARDSPTETGEEGASTTSTTPGSKPRTYTVRAGDNFGAIAEQTGVSVEELQELNPTVDPQALTVGEKIKLAE
jgi:teichoic acid transport system ATP-binding protein